MRPTAFHLSAFRAFFCGTVAVSLVTGVAMLEGRLRLLVLMPEQTHPWVNLGALRFMNQAVGGTTVLGLYLWGLAALFLAAAWGVRGRWSMATSFAGYLWLSLSICAPIEIFFTYAHFFAFLTLLASDGAFEFSLRDLVWGEKAIDRGAREGWAVIALEAIIPWLYFLSFVAKLKNGGMAWVNGEALRTYLYLNYLGNGGSISLWLAERPFVCGVLAMVTLFVESLFCLILFSRKYRRLFPTVALVFHVTIYVIMDINYLWMGTAFFWIYYDFASLREKWAHGGRRGSGIGARP